MEKPNRNNNDKKKCGSDVVSHLPASTIVAVLPSDIDQIRVRKNKGKGKENVPPPNMPAVAPEPEWLTRAAGGEAVAVPRSANEEREALDELVAGAGSEEVLDGDVPEGTVSASKPIVSHIVDIMVQATRAIPPEEAREGFHLPSTSSDEGQLPRAESTQTNQVSATAQPCAVAQNQDFACELPNVAPATGQWSWGTLSASHRFSAPTVAATLQPANWGEGFFMSDEGDEGTEDEDEDELL